MSSVGLSQLPEAFSTIRMLMAQQVSHMEGNEENMQFLPVKPPSYKIEHLKRENWIDGQLQDNEGFNTPLSIQIALLNSFTAKNSSNRLDLQKEAESSIRKGSSSQVQSQDSQTLKVIEILTPIHNDEVIRDSRETRIAIKKPEPLNDTLLREVRHWIKPSTELRESRKVDSLITKLKTSAQITLEEETLLNQLNLAAHSLDSDENEPLEQKLPPELIGIFQVKSKSSLNFFKASDFDFGTTRIEKA
ncbi:MAG: hypothetical protein K1060chlam2_00123 [Chlamydiae bacterium]|nr:hypothetical protein [Chlamydiota bacterium]